MKANLVPFSALLGAAVVLSGGVTAHADTLFDFNSNPIGETTPFTNTVSGISATFTGGTVASGTLYDVPFTGVLSGDPIDITFNQDLFGINATFNVPNATPVPLTPAHFTLDTYENGVFVGQSFGDNFNPGNHGTGAGLSFSNGSPFNEVRLNGINALVVFSVSSTPVPEPSSLAAFGLGAAALATFAFRKRRVNRA